MIFLGEASNYKGKIFHHLFANGNIKDSISLKKYLAKTYNIEPENVILTANGRSALCLGIKSLIPKNSEIVLNGFTCQAVVTAIKESGCTPIFADIEKQTLNYTPETLKHLLRTHNNIKAFIIQNSLGNTVDIKKFETIAKSNHLILIEDLAHCAGQRYPDGRITGSIGDIAAFSFGKGKSLDAITGGALILKNQVLTNQKEPNEHPKFGSNFRARFYPLFGKFIQISFHLHISKYVTGILLRLHLIERSADAPLDLIHRLSHWQAKLILEQLKSMPKNPKKIRDFKLIHNREDALKKLRKHGYIFDEIWYDVPISPKRYYKHSNFDEKACPIATEVSKEIINIPSWVEASKLETAKQIIKEYEIND